MPELISFPFRLTTSGQVATHDDSSVDYYAEELAMLILTRLGERQLVPDYGVSDPAFDVVDVTELKLQVSMFGPPVNVVNVSTVFNTDTTQDVEVQFEPEATEESISNPTTGVI